ncbi:MAG TPA: hypothetical protein VGB62_07455 [Allosphingosinicella sp.]
MASAALAALLLCVSAPASAQAQRPAPAAQAPRASIVPLPDPLTLTKLVWSTMAAVDHANRTGNYAVLRALGTPSFQTANSATSLSGVFAGVRQIRLDMSNTLLIEPLFEFPPAVQNGYLRMRGAFRMRPTGVAFDLLFQWNNGNWQLEGIAVEPLAMTVQSPR